MSMASNLARRFYDDIVTSPINIFLVGLILYFSYKLFKKDPTSSDSSDNRSGKHGDRKVKKLDKMPKRDFTIEQLKEFDGVSNTEGRILFAVLGRVFDVSSSAHLYGKDGPYSVFAGRDASRGLATFSVDTSQLKDTYDDLSDLKPSELATVKEWEMQFLEKYPVVGKLLKPDEEPTNYDDESNKGDAQVAESSNDDNQNSKTD